MFVNAKEAQSAVVSRIDVVLALAHKLKAGLDLVAAAGEDHVVFKLALGRVEYLNQIAKSEPAAPPLLPVISISTRPGA